jgi:hypothetical protein
VLKLKFVPNPLNSPLQNFEVKLESLSDTIVLGIPCNLTIYHMYISTIFVSLYVDFTGIKWASLVRFSTTIIIESCFLTVLGSLVMKSMVTTSHFHSRMGKGYRKPARCLCSSLTFLHSRHLGIKSITSFFIPSQKYCFLLRQFFSSNLGIQHKEPYPSMKIT